jgi:hypothetical protein
MLYEGKLVNKGTIVADSPGEWFIRPNWRSNQSERQYAGRVGVRRTAARTCAAPWPAWARRYAILIASTRIPPHAASCQQFARLKQEVRVRRFAEDFVACGRRFHRSARRPAPAASKRRKQRPVQIIGDHDAGEASRRKRPGRRPFSRSCCRGAMPGAPQAASAWASRSTASTGWPSAASRRAWRPLPQARSSTSPGRNQRREARTQARHFRACAAISCTTGPWPRARRAWFPAPALRAFSQPSATMARTSVGSSRYCWARSRIGSCSASARRRSPAACIRGSRCRRCGSPSDPVLGGSSE